ncbi:hypothetical protein O181_057121 [Austropuccinia psidii MF-1]|uniref:Uncharacterized protein n=1 Tax=Austropuccinia psidii MF-1 TaxID=1389203 RepID=A0A9Q3HTM0_9BASI|nr:hypothetical protein [Austropuccinia psidii MF-1]
MEDARAFKTLIESPAAEITAIIAVRPESFPTGNSGDIPVSVQEVVYGHKGEGVGTSAKPLDRHNKLLYSSENVHGPRKDSRPSEVLDTNVFQRTSPKLKDRLKNKRILSEDQRKDLTKKRDNSPVEAP